MAIPPLRVLHEDNHLLVVDKPAGWPAAHYEGTLETVDRQAKEYLKAKYAKPGNVFVGVVHRIDKPTSGVLVFARTSKAAARLSEQFRTQGVHKKYLAVVRATPRCQDLPKDGLFEDRLVEDESVRLVRVALPGEDAKLARTRFRVLSRNAGQALVELFPETGRKHQLRVQLAHRGWPIHGDRKYGSVITEGEWIALHAQQIEFNHPTTGDRLTFMAGVPATWLRRFAVLFETVAIQ